MRGRPTHLTVTLTPAQRATLQTWQRASTMQVGHVRRGRVVLLLADGWSITAIAHAVGIARHHVYKWVRRFQAHGLDGLRDRPRRAVAHRRWTGEEA